MTRGDNISRLQHIMKKTPSVGHWKIQEIHVHMYYHVLKLNYTREACCAFHNNVRKKTFTMPPPPLSETPSWTQCASYNLCELTSCSVLHWLWLVGQPLKTQQAMLSFNTDTCNELKIQHQPSKGRWNRKIIGAIWHARKPINTGFILALVATRHCAGNTKNQHVPFICNPLQKQWNKKANYSCVFPLHQRHLGSTSQDEYQTKVVVVFTPTYIKQHKT